ncbi:MAG: hypothetical protein AAF560_12775 [Acidobacteriota bacterium]
MDLASYDLDSQPSPWRRRALRAALTLVRLAMLGLALWPPGVVVQHPPAEQRSESAVSCGRKLGTLAMAVATGHTLERQLSEEELNAHLDRLLSQNEDSRQSRGLTLGLTDLAVDLEATRATMYVTGRLLVVPLVFTARFSAVPPAAVPAASPLKLRSLHIGRLPLLGPFRALVGSQMTQLLAKLPTESTVLQHADAFDLADDRVAVRVEGSVEGEMMLPPG